MKLEKRLRDWPSIFGEGRAIMYLTDKELAQYNQLRGAYRVMRMHQGSGGLTHSHNAIYSRLQGVLKEVESGDPEFVHDMEQIIQEYQKYRSGE